MERLLLLDFECDERSAGEDDVSQPVRSISVTFSRCGRTESLPILVEGTLLEVNPACMRDRPAATERTPVPHIGQQLIASTSRQLVARIRRARRLEFGNFHALTSTTQRQNRFVLVRDQRDSLATTHSMRCRRFQYSANLVSLSTHSRATSCECASNLASSPVVKRTLNVFSSRPSDREVA